VLCLEVLVSVLPTAVYVDLEDLAAQPETNLSGTATLLGAQEPYISGNGKSIIRFTVPGSTSTGAQADGPSAPTSAVARTTGGAIEDATYTYFLTEYDGSESLPGDTITATIATSGADTGSVVLALPSVFNSNVVRRFLYRKQGAGTAYQVAQLDDLSVTTYIDTAIESSITGNPTPAGSANPAGRMTFLLMAPADLADHQNPTATLSYSIVINEITYYTNGTWAHSGSPIALTSILAAAPASGIVTQIFWYLIDPAEGPQQSKISSFRISQDTFATDTGAAILAQAPATNTAAGGSDSTGYGTLFLKPNAETNIPGSFYSYQLDTAGQSQVFKIQVPMPDLGGHPDGFEISELSPVLVGTPGQLVANLAAIQAVTTEVDHPYASLSASSTAEGELVNIPRYHSGG
jgi:hypothetical protein